jgi:predicted nuclease with TOPRIM domain
VRNYRPAELSLEAAREKLSAVAGAVSGKDNEIAALEATRVDIDRLARAQEEADELKRRRDKLESELTRQRDELKSIESDLGDIEERA